MFGVVGSVTAVVYDAALIDRYRASGWWGSDTLSQLLDARAAERPDAVALVDAPNRSAWFSGDEQRLTWAEVVGAVDAVAARLAADGVGHGSPVGIQLPNVAELAVSLLALARLGAVGVPFPIQHRSHELATGWEAAALAGFITGARPDRSDQLQTVASVASGFAEPRLWVYGPGGDQFHRLTLDPGGDDPVPTPAGHPDEVATICWTSGTTGTPKGVPRTHNGWVAAGKFNVAGVGLTADDRVLCPFPLVNMAGIGGMLVPWLLAGFRLVLHQPFDLVVFLSQVGSEQITYTVAPPPLLNMLLRSTDLLATADMSSVRAIASGAAPLDPSMVTGWQSQHGIEVINIFGSNEGAALLSTRELVPDPGERARFFPRLGRSEMDWPTPVASENETRLVDPESGEEITQPGRIGELRFRGPTVFGGYLHSDGTEFDADGFFRTGDLFEIAGPPGDPRYYRFVDRAKDIIIRGGMNISATEVETMLLTHPQVREVAAVAAPAGDLGEVVAVFVVPAADDPPQLDGLAAHLRAQGIASYKLPERLIVVAELPRNPLGKVLKAELREQMAAG